MSDPQLKKLKIQTGVVRRCGKEKLSYRKEADMQKEKVEKMKAEGKDEYEIRKMNECVQESLMMIPDCHRRLEKAYNDLKALVAELESVEELAASPDMAAAKKVMEEAIDQLKAE